MFKVNNNNEFYLKILGKNKIIDFIFIYILWGVGLGWKIKGKEVEDRRVYGNILFYYLCIRFYFFMFIVWIDFDFLSY